MGHGKNKQKTQKVGLGQQPKETREERRKRIEEEAKAREFCMKLLPYALGVVVFMILAFALYVHSLPPKNSIEKQTPLSIKVETDETERGKEFGKTFEEALQAHFLDDLEAELLKQDELLKGAGPVQEDETVNLDGDNL